MTIGIEFIVGCLIGLAAIAGAFVGGKRNAAIAADTIAILNTRMDIFEAESKKIPALMQRIGILEELVTQRADVEGVKEIVLRIEEKLDGRP
jgi:hypothetical protein